MRNPFTPTFGIVPPYMAGRNELLDTMARAFENGLGDPNLCTLLIGPRGSGKTALLSCIGDEAREAGWIVVDAAAEEGMLEEIIQHVSLEASQITDTLPKKHLKGINVGDMVGLEWEEDEREKKTWRIRMEDALRQIAEKGVGLLITVDEVRVDVEEMVRLASAYQLFVRGGFNVALVLAGLPANVTDLVQDSRISFLRRARQRYLNVIGDTDVGRAFRKTIEAAGKSISEEALKIAVKASGGFPYMIQLVGYGMWAESGSSVRIDEEDAERGSATAKADFTAGVLERTWLEMSRGDRRFAQAMLPDEGPSALAEVARRMGCGTNYASTYKQRLLRRGIIGERPGSTFDFDIPLMREYLAAKSGTT